MRRQLVARCVRAGPRVERITIASTTTRARRLKASSNATGSMFETGVIVRWIAG